MKATHKQKKLLHSVRIMKRENIKILYAFSEMVTVRTLPNKTGNRKKANKKEKSLDIAKCPSEHKLLLLVYSCFLLGNNNMDLSIAQDTVLCMI